MAHIVIEIPDTVIGEALLPNLEVCAARLPGSMRETTFDQLQRSFEGNLLRSYEQMNMIWHDHKFMQVVPAFASILLECVKKQVCQFSGLEESTALPTLGGNKVSSEIVSSRRFQMRPSAAKAASFMSLIGAAEAAPLRNRKPEQKARTEGPNSKPKQQAETASPNRKPAEKALTESPKRRPKEKAQRESLRDANFNDSLTEDHFIDSRSTSVPQGFRGGLCIGIFRPAFSANCAACS